MTDDIVHLGDEVDLEITNAGSGGVFISRHNGKIVFVRGAIAGETVIAVITAINAKWLRADVVKVKKPSHFRIIPACTYSQVCGGCDFQHIEISHQREIKSQILQEHLRHIAGITEISGRDVDHVKVKAMHEDDNGLRWRTRMRFARHGLKSIGMFTSRTKSVVEIDDCLIGAADSIPVARAAMNVVKGPEITVVARGLKRDVVDSAGGPMIDEKVLHRIWHLKASSFWQVHKSAPEMFVQVVLRMAKLQDSQSALDLYSGSGLFAAFLAEAVGENGIVIAVESNMDAVRNARRSCSDLPALELVTSDVEKWLQNCTEIQFDVVVLDPPRAGAGALVCERISTMAKRSIIYVACDSSSLARDTAKLSQLGWKLSELEAYDAFPMTSHFECIAHFVRQ